MSFNKLPYLGGQLLKRLHCVNILLCALFSRVPELEYLWVYFPVIWQRQLKTSDNQAQMMLAAVKRFYISSRFSSCLKQRYISVSPQNYYYGFKII